MDELIPPKLILRPNHREEIIEIVTKLAPKEACGIIAGETDTSSKVYPVTNTLNSSSEYLMDPEQMLEAFWDIEENGWQVLAFFHSHPSSQPFPSQSDLSRNFYPHTIHMIAGKIESNWVLKAFQLFEKNYNEIPIVNLST
ncbi:MAG: M67 family metallopeptidase [Anaerolineales bacterium]